MGKAKLSQRAAKDKDEPNLLHTAWYRHNQNSYHPKNNPNGIINLGTAENRVIYDIIEEKLADIKLQNMGEQYTHYCKLSGTDQFRSKLGSFFNKFMSPKESIKPNDIYVMNGCGTVIEALGYSICDEGDGVLVPAPFYTGFKSDLEQRVGVKVVPVHLPCKGPEAFKLTTELLEDAFEKAEVTGTPIKALLLANPNNPLGTVYTEEELTMYAEFCYNFNIHLICDEIYMLSVYDSDASFKSLLSIDNFEKYRDIIHVVWGFSKDFSLSGFRCGVAITKNVELQRALTSVGYYTSVPTSTQYILEELITDVQWLDKLIYLNHQRLNESRNFVIEKLRQERIPFVYPKSGLFIWVNLSKCMRIKTLESETELFEKLMANGLYIVPGQAFETKEYGWFRMIISNEVNVLTIAMERLKRLVKDNKQFPEIGSRRRSSDSLHHLESLVLLSNRKSKLRSG